MNESERRTIARALLEADEQGVTIPSLERFRGLIERRPPKIPSRPKGNPIPSASREVVAERSGGLCEANTPDCPPRPHLADHIHHVAGRFDHDPKSLLNVCLAAHQWIHAHPEQSRVNGWMRSRLGTIR